jgi:hypothetical protein
MCGILQEGLLIVRGNIKTLNENLSGLITFHHFLSYKNLSWSKDKVTHWIGVVE